MIIGIDIRVLTRGARTGIEEYTINLLSRLFLLGREHQFKLFYNAFSQQPLEFNWEELPNVKIYRFHFPNRFVLDPLAKFFRMPKIDALLGGVDIFFSSHFLLGETNCPKILTFHDLSFEYFPEFFSAQKRLWHSFVNPRQRAREARGIIAVSGSTKNDLIDLYGIEERKIKTIYSGVAENFQRLEIKDGELEIRKKYGLPPKFILYFGTIEPRKNLEGLIGAYEIFRRKNPDLNHALVLAGAPGWLCQKIFSAASRSTFKKDIVFTGFVEPQDKSALYNLASLFVFPSLFEGFGFPPLEAMACGVPTIASFTSSFPEVIDDGALLVDPYNLGELAWAMAEVLRDENLREDLIFKGFGRARNFSWDKCARETLEFLISNS